jgi:hypothetical protein
MGQSKGRDNVQKQVSERAKHRGTRRGDSAAYLCEDCCGSSVPQDP